VLLNESLCSSLCRTILVRDCSNRVLLSVELHGIHYELLSAVQASCSVHNLSIHPRRLQHLVNTIPCVQTGMMLYCGVHQIMGCTQLCHEQDRCRRDGLFLVIAGNLKWYDCSGCARTRRSAIANNLWLSA
jgi:hypothetical protein